MLFYHWKYLSQPIQPPPTEGQGAKVFVDDIQKLFSSGQPKECKVAKKRIGQDFSKSIFLVIIIAATFFFIAVESWREKLISTQGLRAQ